MPPVRLSIVMPLAPGETAWCGLLEQLRALPADSEIVLVRAEEALLALPAAWPAGPRLRQCRSRPGRAAQMNAGARVARGRWLWFLHADSRLTPQTWPALQAFIAAGAPALGYFRLKFLRDGPRLAALNALGANLRARWLGLPFGDQGFVLRAEDFARLGGYDERLACGEDHFLVWRARAAGLPLREIPAALATSARKYAERGWAATTVRHWRLTLAQARQAARETRRVEP